MSDVIERAEAVLRHRDTRIGHGLIRDLIAELKTERAAAERIRECAAQPSVNAMPRPLNPDKVLQIIAALAQSWAYQDTDYDGDTEQQIADGNLLLRILREAGVSAAEPLPPPEPVDPNWIEHLSHPTKLRRAVDGLEPVAGCKFCREGR
ncbi:hypothetical protein [Mycobacterium sp. E1747]|uniref:hypothetical protein n=1 Tax=Mycobacterium sp. E1747 TaxID=1834128 RepID=UPI0012E9DF71|nr:hypothetical protein [Mycobacterium sp. E1747]